MKKIYTYFPFLLLLFHFSSTMAQLRLPFVIGSNMVLQCNQPVPVWGYAMAGDEIKVQFNGQSKTATTDAYGKWQLNLDPLPVSATPAEMTISTKDSSIRLQNILVGEVWLCSGQSNMEYSMRKNSKTEKVLNTRVPAPEGELEKANNPLIRIFLVRNDYSKAHPLRHTWDTAAGTKLVDFSAPGYFFAKELYRQLNVPIGIISAAIPGSQIEPWMPVTIRGDTTHGRETGKFYTTMISPLAPFALRGFLWYQGESNCFLNDTTTYVGKMLVLIESWRHLWHSSTLPFYYVQIAPFLYSQSKDGRPHTPQTLAEFREQQFLALNISYTGMVVTTDLADNLNDIHPSYKWEVGRRLALLALAKAYKKPIEYAGPQLKTIKKEGSALLLTFTHADGGLVSIDGKPIDWIEIAGDDHIFVPAGAVIKDNALVVSAPGIKSPAVVRFGWNEAAQPNLYNKQGLPAVQFNTLYWNDIEKIIANK